jgi:hypothetical protein
VRRAGAEVREDEEEQTVLELDVDDDVGGRPVLVRAHSSSLRRLRGHV